MKDRNSIRYYLRGIPAVMALTLLCSISVSAHSGAPEDTGMAISDSAAAGESAGTATTFTPDGNGTVVDEASSADNKHFYTIQTENGNYFYLIIDGNKDSDNVYLTSLVDEQKLMEYVKKANANGDTSMENSSGSLSSDSLFGKEASDSASSEAATVKQESPAAASTEKAAADVPATGLSSGAVSDSPVMTVFIIILMVSIFAIVLIVWLVKYRNRNGSSRAGGFDEFEDDPDYVEQEEDDNPVRDIRPEPAGEDDGQNEHPEEQEQKEQTDSII